MRWRMNSYYNSVFVRRNEKQDTVRNNYNRNAGNQSKERNKVETALLLIPVHKAARNLPAVIKKVLLLIYKISIYKKRKIRQPECCR